MLIKMICFSVTKENLVRGSEKLQQIVSELGPCDHMVTELTIEHMWGRVNLHLPVGGSEEPSRHLNTTSPYSRAALNSLSPGNLLSATNLSAGLDQWFWILKSQQIHQGYFHTLGTRSSSQAIAQESVLTRLSSLDEFKLQVGLFTLSPPISRPNDGIPSAFSITVFQVHALVWCWSFTVSSTRLGAITREPQFWVCLWVHFQSDLTEKTDSECGLQPLWTEVLDRIQGD